MNRKCTKIASSFKPKAGYKNTAECEIQSTAESSKPKAECEIQNTAESSKPKAESEIQSTAESCKAGYRVAKKVPGQKPGNFYLYKL